MSTTSTYHSPFQTADNTSTAISEIGNISLIEENRSTIQDPSAPVFYQPNSQQPSSYFFYWNSYLLILMLAHLAGLFFKGHLSDQGFWVDWVKQLSTQGYDKFNGNYPPIYIHWLYVLGKFYTLAQMPIESDLLLKFLTQLPVIAVQILFCRFVFTQLIRANVSSQALHISMLLCVLNPAFMLNGSIWGQVDMLPAYFVFLGIFFGISERHIYLMLPFFVLSLLTKFQMIALAPIFGFLFFRKPIQQIIGIILAVILVVVVFAPYILAGYFMVAVKQAYIDTLGQYPLTTFNAANIWMLLTGNSVPDSIILFGSHSKTMEKLFTAKYFGMILFSMTSLIVFIVGMFHQIKFNINLANEVLNEAARRDLLKNHFKLVLLASTLNTVAFFTFLPAMHERYMFPAVVFALAYYAVAQQKIFIPIAVSLFCAANMLIIVELNGSDIWFGLSWLILLVCGVLILDFLTQSWTSHYFTNAIKQLLHRKHMGIMLSIIILNLMGTILCNRLKPHTLDLMDHEILLSDLPIFHAKQDHGKPKLNRSFDDHMLSLGGKRFEKGIGAHANSSIQFKLPDKVKTLSFMVGLDDEVTNSEVSFSVWGDEKQIWSSQVYYGHESAEKITINIENVHLLTLKVDARGSDHSDHANWINPVIQLDTQSR